MSEANKNPAGPESLEEELVAYLDGELDGKSCQRVEQRLAEDALKLQAAWTYFEAGRTEGHRVVERA